MKDSHSPTHLHPFNMTLNATDRKCQPATELETAMCTCNHNDRKEKTQEDGWKDGLKKRGRTLKWGKHNTAAGIIRRYRARCKDTNQRRTGAPAKRGSFACSHSAAQQRQKQAGKLCMTYRLGMADYGGELEFL